jgi:hypothetical protein
MARQAARARPHAENGLPLALATAVLGVLLSMALMVTVTVLTTGANPSKPSSPLPDRAGGQDHHRRRPSRLPIGGPCSQRVRRLRLHPDRQRDGGVQVQRGRDPRQRGDHVEAGQPGDADPAGPDFGPQPGPDRGPRTCNICGAVLVRVTGPVRPIRNSRSGEVRILRSKAWKSARTRWNRSLRLTRKIASLATSSSTGL